MTQANERIAEFKGQVWKVKADKSQGKDYPCLWMAAGAVKKKSCSNFFQCSTCKYDMAMNQKVAKGRQVSWQDVMRRQESTSRVCRHTLTKRVAGRTCPMNYNCSRCDFDQYFEDFLTTRTGRGEWVMDEVRGFNLPMGHYFHNGHTWVRMDSGGVVRLGLDDFSMKLLGQPDGITLPLAGKELNRDTAAWGFSRAGKEAEVLSPVDGVILEVNPKVRNDPGLIARDPYGDGWLFAVHTPDVKKTFGTLMEEGATQAWMIREVDQLESMIESVAGPMTTDGGLLAPDIFGNLPHLGWSNLTRAFLKT